MQILYRLDVAGEEPSETMYEDLDDYDSPDIRRQGLELALAAWAEHAQFDTRIAELTPDWPTHRQPPVDRAILRLGAHEMVSGFSPPRIAINEAVELAKHYGDKNSPTFINGVLDKLAKKLELPLVGPDPNDPSADRTTNAQADDDAVDPWLADATRTPA